MNIMGGFFVCAFGRPAPGCNRFIVALDRFGNVLVSLRMLRLNTVTFYESGADRTGERQSITKGIGD